MGGAMQKNRGFTLIELMVTIAVLAVIASFAVPAFGDMLEKQNLKKSAEELIVVMNKARSKAVIERRPHITVNLAPSANAVDTNEELNWRPSGKSILKTGSPTTIQFGITGGVFISDTDHPTSVSPATSDTVFTICSSSTGTNKKSKTIAVSRMGTIQIISEGTC